MLGRDEYLMEFLLLLILLASPATTFLMVFHASPPRITWVSSTGRLWWLFVLSHSHYVWQTGVTSASELPLQASIFSMKQGHWQEWVRKEGRNRDTGKPSGMVTLCAQVPYFCTHEGCGELMGVQPWGWLCRGIPSRMRECLVSEAFKIIGVVSNFNE